MTENFCPWCEGERSHVGVPYAACPERDLLAEASITGRIHARRGRRCAVDTAERLFGARAARAYESGYRREMAKAAVA